MGHYKTVCLWGKYCCSAAADEGGLVPVGIYRGLSLSKIVGQIFITFVGNGIDFLSLGTDVNSRSAANDENDMGPKTAGGIASIVAANFAFRWSK